MRKTLNTLAIRAECKLSLRRDNWYTLLYSMTAYNLTPPTTLPSLAWQETKEKRKKVLEAVRQRRAEAYKRLRERVSGTAPQPSDRAGYASKSSYLKPDTD